jgi:hypothetical protein
MVTSLLTPSFAWRAVHKWCWMFQQRFPTDNVYEWKLTNAGEWKAHFMRGTIKYEATVMQPAHS